MNKNKNFIDPQTDKMVPVKLKSKLYKTVVRPANVYGSECWALRKQEEQRLHTTEMKMLRWSQGKTRKDTIKNETIRGNAKVTPINSVLTQKRLSWYGHVMRRDETQLQRNKAYITHLEAAGADTRSETKTYCGLGQHPVRI